MPSTTPIQPMPMHQWFSPTPKRYDRNEGAFFRGLDVAADPVIDFTAIVERLRNEEMQRWRLRRPGPDIDLITTAAQGTTRTGRDWNPPAEVEFQQLRNQLQAMRRQMEQNVAAGHTVAIVHPRHLETMRGLRFEDAWIDEIPRAFPEPDPEPELPYETWTDFVEVGGRPVPVTFTRNV